MEIAITALFVAITMYVICLISAIVDQGYKGLVIVSVVFMALLLAALLY